MTPRTRFRHARSLPALGAAITAHAAVSGSHSALEPAGPQAADLFSLTSLLTWVCVAVFVTVMAFLLMALVRRRPDLPDREEIPVAARRRFTAFVTVGLGLTALVLFGFLIAALRTDRRMAAAEGGPDVVTIRITGKQWWWEIQYEDNEPSSVFTTANEIHIPVGRPIHLKLQTADVIHSLWIPSLQGKKDMIPGRENNLWLTVDRPGEYAGQCAEFCGLQHAHMSLLVVAEPNEQFEAWKNQQRASAASPPTDSARRGRDVFLGSTCVMCHAVQGTPAGSRAGPDLTHLASRRTLGAASLPNNRDNLTAWVLDPASVKPGTRMPSHKFSPDDLHALLDYLEALK
jgi:cytochrome c oxidase subunit 2